MSLRGLRAQFARLKARAERRDAPTFDEYWSAARHETARRLSSVYERLAHIPGNGPPTLQQPGCDGRDSLLADDTPEQAESDRRVVGAWETAHGRADIKGVADEARAKLLGGGRGY